ncbi:peptidase inhibitor family I36 protein [Streptomyces sp. NPDC101151]|uniref:peptidase inhibitor family I36 protein n=1 Tax=Streptomyces sp. NPDC101151 TaxID=3366115 RepID=UPI0037FCA629
MWRKTATAVAALALTCAGVVFSPPASAAEPCRAGGLCLYRNTGFINMKFVTTRRSTCWDLADYGLANNVFSYRNNMPVYAHFFDASGDENVWNIRNGGSSSDSSSFSGERFVCTD